MAPNFGGREIELMEFTALGEVPKHLCSEHHGSIWVAQLLSDTQTPRR